MNEYVPSTWYFSYGQVLWCLKHGHNYFLIFLFKNGRHFKNSSVSLQSVSHSQNLRHTFNGQAKKKKPTDIPRLKL